ncbi:hypothetical protein [Okeania sp. SIO2B9]|uniref:hypothetical protein n=1 Tax=Okeania sp. SIO2B9 TaxID=2607782 RepID=UPI00142C1716|nr:hypothetical protein [Okeania sp. SIO2B9]NES89767.1 hypothetical protein [Okeania sp. SIO2B9]
MNIREFISLIKVISCPVEYLHFGGGKAEGRRQKAGGRRQEAEAVRPRVGVRRKGMRTKRGKKRLEGKKFFYHAIIRT